MALDPVKIAIAVESGLSIMCATCFKYWDARDRGVPGHRCTAPVGSCGSPIAGMSFPLYVGPVTEFDRWCFVCGGTPEYRVVVPLVVPKRPNRKFAVCGKHIELLKVLRPVGVDPPRIISAVE